MKNTSRKHYIYKVTNLETGQYYIGSQCSGKTIGVNYFTSSTNKEFMEGFKTYREEKYKIEIIKEFEEFEELEDPKKCVRVENYMIRDHMLLKDGLCLNKFCCCNGEKIFSRVGTHHSEETRKKLSITHKGQSPWNKGIPSPKKGIPLPEETRKKLSEALKGRPLSEETKQKISRALKGRGPNKGTHLSEETRKKLSISKKGIPSPKKGTHLPEETRKKISISHKIKISIDGIVSDSITEASKYHNMSTKTIRRWVKKNQHNAFLIEK